MRRDWVTEVCEREYDRMAQEARDAYKPAQITPVIGGPYHAGQHAELMAKVARALAAQQWHARTAVYSWANPLPLREEQFKSLMYTSHNAALKLKGYFGRSLR